MKDEDYSEIDTTESEFEAMWERATPVQTVVRYVAQPQTFASVAAVTFKARWTAEKASEHSETASAYARVAAG